MPIHTATHATYLEIGTRKNFAGVISWPGWCRAGSDEEAAKQALLDYASRYAAILRSTDLTLELPATTASFNVVERLEGNTTTDFGAPSVMFPSDRKPVTPADLQRFNTLLHQSWHALDQALDASKGVMLRKGPRGGGRDQQKLLEHIIMADESYLAKLGWKLGKVDRDKAENVLTQLRRAILEGLKASVEGEISEKGPRGGLHWTPRFFVRRVIWHILDHAWEIEDRMT